MIGRAIQIRSIFPNCAQLFPPPLLRHHNDQLRPTTSFSILGQIPLLQLSLQLDLYHAIPIHRRLLLSLPSLIRRNDFGLVRAPNKSNLSLSSNDKNDNSCNFNFSNKRSDNNISTIGNKMIHENQPLLPPLSTPHLNYIRRQLIDLDPITMVLRSCFENRRSYNNITRLMNQQGDGNSILHPAVRTMSIA
jgi:hypothetical protein